MPLLWEDRAWADYQYWMDQDKKTLRKFAESLFVNCTYVGSNDKCVGTKRICRNKAQEIIRDIDALPVLADKDKVESNARDIYLRLEALNADNAKEASIDCRVENGIEAINIAGEVPDMFAEIAVKGEPATPGKQQDQKASAQSFASNIRNLYNACQDVLKGEDEDARKKRRNANLAAGAVTSIVGGALGAGITASVLAAKYEDAENKAIEEWMEEIGEHIQCYVGTQELGSYGDVAIFNID